MKKLLFVCFFIFFGFCSFSANINSDEARQRAVAEAQRWVNEKIPYQFDGIHDCSGLVLSAYNQAGLKYPRGSSANGRQTQSMFNGVENKISPGQENLLKPGDALFFTRGGSAQGGIGHVGIVISTNSARCGGGVEYIDTASKRRPPRPNCLKDSTGYAGAISFDEIIRANGHTPVDSGGNVLPSIGSPITGYGSGTQYYNSGYTIDFDAVLQKYVDVFESGLVNLGQTLVVILTFVFLIDFVLKCIRERVTNLEVISIELFFGLLTFAFYLIVIRKLPLINEYGLKSCFTVAGAFDSNLTDYKVLNQIMTIYIQNCEYLIKEFGKESMGITGFLNIITFNHFKIAFLMGMIFIMTGIFGYLVFQITKVIMTFIIAVNINAIFIPFYYSGLLREYIPNPLTIFFKAWIQMFFSVVFISISLKIIDNKAIPAVQDGFDIIGIFTYTVYFMLVTFVLKKMLKKIASIV